MVCAKKGYKAIFVLPDKMSQEKIQLLRAFGARVVITPLQSLQMTHVRTSVLPSACRKRHPMPSSPTSTTTPRTLAATTSPPVPKSGNRPGGKVTDVVMGMGTGGTISGIGRYLKEQNPNIRIIGVDPVGSLLMETWREGAPT